MEKELIDQIHTCSKVKGKQRTWISELSDDQLVKLFMMVKRGGTAKSIAAEIQRKWGIRKGSTVHSLSQGILKFKNRTSDLASSPPQLTIPVPVSFNKSNYQPTDNLEQNEKIASDLRERIDRMLEEERQLGISFPTLSRDLLALVALEKTILKQKEHLIKFQHRDPLKNIQKRDEDAEMKKLFNNIVKQIAPDLEKKQKFLDSTNRFIELIEKETINVVKDKNGNWRKVD